ncbi:MAG: hypothetical protein ACO1O1_13035 [Adhaeribacter sp.]
MNKRRRKWLAGLVIALLATWFIADAVNEPGVQDLPGDFEQVAMYRNENNTGPIIRLYAVTVSDTLWKEMEQYGQFMPHTKYGTTRVYFFRQGSPAPKELQPGAEPFEARLKPYCLARYEKDAMGTSSFRRSPF